MQRAHVFWIHLFILAATSPAWSEEGWTQFRGPTGDGRVARLAVPTEWSESQNVAWKIPIPGSGWGQPIVLGDQILVVSSNDDKDSKPASFEKGLRDLGSMLGGLKGAPKFNVRWELHGFDLASGEKRWSTRIADQEPGLPIHASNTFAPETPATDGERVFIWLAQVGKVFCLDAQGASSWTAELGVHPISMGYGSGNSIAVADGKVFVLSDNEESSFLVALDAKTGEQAWRADRPCKSSWSTPYLWRNRVRTELIAAGQGRVVSYDPATGKILWEYAGIKEPFIATPVGSADLLYVGTNGPTSDGPLLAFRAGVSGAVPALAKGTTSNEAIAWSRRKAGPGIPSMVADDGHLYIAGDKFLSCIDATTGEPVYKERLKGARILIASPIVGAGKVFLFDETGTTFVIATGSKFELLANNKLDDLFWSSPAVAGDSLILRGMEHLYCIRGAR